MIGKFVLHRGIIPTLISNYSMFDKLQIFVKYKFIPIYYRGFYDIPEVFLTEYESKVYLFTRDFDDELDDYQPDYEVYEVKNISLNDAVKGNFWFPHNFENKVFVGKIPTKDVVFDWTNRKFVNTTIFEKLN
jgi:hypothetical protein